MRAVYLQACSAPNAFSSGRACVYTQERSLGWQLVKLGWSPKRLVPPELLERPRKDWSAAERKAFTKGLSSQVRSVRGCLRVQKALSCSRQGRLVTTPHIPLTPLQGKHFRPLLELLPGRSMDELVERYYATKTHKRMAQVKG